MTTEARPGRRIEWEDIHLPGWVSALIGIVAMLILWWIVAVLWVGASGVHVIPTPLEVVVAFADAGWDFFAKNFGVTLAEAGIGYLWGNALALLLAAIVLVLPRLEGIAMQLAIITYCIPIVAIGILGGVIIGPPEAGQPSGNGIFLAALSVFFTTVVGALLGLKSADKSSLDLITVYGGGKLTQLRKVRLTAALPAILNALQIAVPAAFLGAVLSEFFGGVETGVGVAMMISMQRSSTALVWALALASGAVALIGFALVGLVARAVAPWSKGVAA